MSVKIEFFHARAVLALLERQLRREAASREPLGHDPDEEERLALEAAKIMREYVDVGQSRPNIPSPEVLEREHQAFESEGDLREFPRVKILDEVPEHLRADSVEDQNRILSGMSFGPPGSDARGETGKPRVQGGDEFDRLAVEFVNLDGNRWMFSGLEGRAMAARFMARHFRSGLDHPDLPPEVARIMERLRVAAQEAREAQDDLRASREMLDAAEIREERAALTLKVIEDGLKDELAKKGGPRC